jgi:hypothetical protein
VPNPEGKLPIVDEITSHARLGGLLKHYGRPALSSSGQTKDRACQIPGVTHNSPLRSTHLASSRSRPAADRTVSFRRRCRTAKSIVTSTACVIAVGWRIALWFGNTCSAVWSRQSSGCPEFEKLDIGEATRNRRGVVHVPSVQLCDSYEAHRTDPNWPLDRGAEATPRVPKKRGRSSAGATGLTGFPTMLSTSRVDQAEDA